jgi:hypothetical protein
MMPAGTLIHYECRPNPLAAEARTTSGSPSIDTVLKLSDRTSYTRKYVFNAVSLYSIFEIRSTGSHKKFVHCLCIDNELREEHENLTVK